MTVATFVLSTGRCGTQWLAKNLGEHYGDLLAVTHEPHLRDYLPRQLLGIADPAQWPTLALLDRHLATIEQHLATKSYIECGWPCYGPLPYFVKRLAGRVRVIHLVRHPVPTAASMVTHLCYHPRPDQLTEKALLTPTDAGVAMPEYAERWATMSRFEKCLYFWGEIALLGLRYERELGIPWLRARSEDMFAGAALDELLDFIGVPRRDAIHAARSSHVDGYFMGTNVKLEADYQSIRRHPRIAAIAQDLGYDALDFNPERLAARYAFAPASGGAGGVKWNPEWVNVPRNAPCPCGSGRKYKQCHGTLA
jgi:SEC-C motif-containing protein